MLVNAMVMPFFAFVYYNYIGKTGVNPMNFYKLAAFGYTMVIILPVVLGTLCTMLMQEENQNDTLKQLWIVPISKMGYFLSKFFIVLIYAILFMLITAIASILFSVIPGFVTFEWGSIFYLIEKCLEIGCLSAFGMLPILAIAASQKGYILPICTTLVYALFGLIITTVNAYIHPLASMSVILMRKGDIPGVTFAQTINIPLAILCIFVWSIASVVFANFALTRRK